MPEPGRPNAPYVVLTSVAGITLLWFLLSGGLAASPDPTGPRAASTAVAPTTAAAGAEGTVSAESTVASSVATSPALPESLAFEVITGGVAEPVFAVVAPGDDRIFVVERAGRVGDRRRWALRGARAGPRSVSRDDPAARRRLGRPLWDPGGQPLRLRRRRP